jgi:hypothetical protein
MKVAQSMSLLTIAFATAVAGALPVSAAAQGAPVKITAMSQANEAGFPLWLANKLGYLKDNGVRREDPVLSPTAARRSLGRVRRMAGGLDRRAAGDHRLGEIRPHPVGTMMKEDRNIKLIMRKDALKGSSPERSAAVEADRHRCRTARGARCCSRARSTSASSPRR